MKINLSSIYIFREKSPSLIRPENSHNIMNICKILQDLMKLFKIYSDETWSNLKYDISL